MVGGLLVSLHWVLGVVPWLATRHPVQLWLLPLPTLVVFVGLTQIIEWAATVADAACLNLPQPTAHALLCLACALLTVPQQRCLRLNRPILALGFAVLILHLQYASAMALTHFPRSLALLAVGIPNLALTAYLIVSWVLCTVVTSSPATARQVLWRAYTVWGPSLLIPQSMLVLMRCTLQCIPIHHRQQCPTMFL